MASNNKLTHHLNTKYTLNIKILDFVNKNKTKDKIELFEFYILQRRPTTLANESVNLPKVLVGEDKKSAKGFSTEGFNLLKVLICSRFHSKD